MISIINASPKVNSNSSYFINLITKKLKENYNINRIYYEEMLDIIDNINISDTLILVFPLYVDAPPSKLLQLMENITNLQNKKIYVISNCGFLETKHTNISIDIIQNWCKKCKGIFMGSFKIGAGEVLGKRSFINNILSPLFKIKINKFIKCINKNKIVNLKVGLIIPKKLFCFFANISWKKQLDKYHKV